MKKLITFLSVLIFTSCSNENDQTKERTIVYEGFLYDISKIRVDSVDYLIAKSAQGISIIKHGEVKTNKSWQNSQNLKNFQLSLKQEEE